MDDLRSVFSSFFKELKLLCEKHDIYTYAQYDEFYFCKFINNEEIKARGEDLDES